MLQSSGSRIAENVAVFAINNSSSHRPSSLLPSHNSSSCIPINQFLLLKMKFAIVSILLYVFAENHLSVSARSLRKLSKGSKVKNYNYKTNPVSTQHTVITISHVVPTDPEPIDNRNDNQGDPIPVPVVQCKECTNEGEFYSNVEHIYQFSNFLFRVSH